MDLNEQLRQAYQAGRRQGLNETLHWDDPKPFLSPPNLWSIPDDDSNPHGVPDLRGNPFFGAPRRSGPDIPRPDKHAMPYARPVCSATGCWQTYRGLNGEWYWQWVPY
jgi:hypothetical protein